MWMYRFLIILVLLVACDKSTEQAIDHLRSIGFKNVACSSETRGISTCTADEVQFRCVMASAEGCSSNNAVACERFYTEKPVP